MDVVTLTYIDAAGNPHNRTMTALSVKGIIRPEHTSRFPILKFDHLNGAISINSKGYRRIITIQLSKTNNDDDIIFVAEFMAANTMSVTYLGEGVSVVPKNMDEHGGVWGLECKYLVDFTLELLESTIMTMWAVAVRSVIVDSFTSDEITIPAINDESNPLSFETGVGDLALDGTGLEYPDFDFDTHLITVEAILPGLQSCPIPCSTPTINRTDHLCFQAAHANYGNPGTSGDFKVRFRINRQAK